MNHGEALRRLRDMASELFDLCDEAIKADDAADDERINYQANVRRLRTERGHLGDVS